MSRPVCSSCGTDLPDAEFSGESSSACPSCGCRATPPGAVLPPDAALQPGTAADAKPPLAGPSRFDRNPGSASTGVFVRPVSDTDLTVSYVALCRDGSVDLGMLDPDAARIAPGTELQGRYRLDSELGRGGFGLVFLGEDLR